MDKSDKKVAVWTRLLAGSLAGASETIVTFPAEYIKTRLQLPPTSQNSLRPTTLSIIRDTFRSQGFKGFYSGCNALIISNSLKSSIRFFTYSFTKEHLQRLPFFGGQNTAVNIVSGLAAGVSESLLVVTPGEALKTRMVDGGKFGGKGVGEVARMVVREEGVRALWRGAVPVLSKQATNSAVRFTTFGLLQEQVKNRWNGMEGKMTTTLGLGAISGIVTVYASMPFDTIKTRVQSAVNPHQGMLSCASSIVRSDGITGLWKGTTPRLVRLTLSSGITFMVYDQVVQTIATLRSPRRQVLPL